MSSVVTRLLRALRGGPRRFAGSAAYWEGRYAGGGSSGVGSYGKFARFKAEVLNGFVARHDVASVIELGCGDGNQLALARYPRYSGYDVSERAVAICRERFAGDPSKRFATLAERDRERAELSLSLDVIYHLVEDEVFEAHMRDLFDAAERFVAIYSSDFDEEERVQGVHVRQRRFSAWVERHRPDWSLVERVPNAYPYDGDYREGSFADFHFYAPASSASGSP